MRLPTLPSLGNLALTYSQMPVWSGSTTKEIQWSKLARKTARQLYYRLRGWELRTKTSRKHGGKIGKPALAVFYVMVFDFMNYITGQLDPSYEGLVQKTGYCRSTVADALKRLRELGVINWIRRCKGVVRDGRFSLEQERNAYFINPEGFWKGYRAPLAVPDAPEAGTWGEHPPLSFGLADTATDERMGLDITAQRRAVMTTLRSDQNDGLAAALAQLGQLMGLDRNSAN